MKGILNIPLMARLMVTLFFCFKELFLCFLHPSKIKQLFCSYENYAITFLYDVVIRVAHNLFHNMHKNHDKRIPTLKGKARSTNTYLNFFNFQSRIKWVRRNIFRRERVFLTTIAGSKTYRLSPISRKSMDAFLRKLTKALSSNWVNLHKWLITISGK